MTQLEEFLQKAEKSIEKAESMMESLKEPRITVPEDYLEPIYLGIKALYEQNKAIIELLKEYKK